MKYLSDYIETKQTELFAKTGSFFAFGNKQFKEKSKEGVAYVDMGSGLICPKDTAEELHIGLEKIWEEAIREDVADNGAEAIIEREYFNHECQISLNTSIVETIIHGYRTLFPDDFGVDKVREVFTRCFNKAVENDWF